MMNWNMTRKKRYKTPLNKWAEEDQRMTTKVEISNVNIATKLICHTLHFILIWNKNIPKDQAEKSETPLPVAGEEVGREKILIKDLIQGLKTSSKLWNEREGQWILCFVMKKYSIKYFRKKSRKSFNKKCMTIQFSSFWFNFQIFLINQESL